MIVGRSYDKLIDTAERIGLVELMPEEQLPLSWGQPHWNGGFSVAKDDMEDRMISPLEWTNDRVDDSRVGRVEMPYLPQMRIISVPKGARLRVSKRDARHDFHQLTRHHTRQPA